MRIWIIIGLVVALTQAVPAGALTLSRGGKAAATIVFAAEATASEQMAAKEVADYLHRISGGDFHVLTENQAPAEGSNIQDKTWFLYRAGTGATIKVSVPAVRPELLELPKRRTAVDRIGGVGTLLTRNGTAASAFVKGLNNYGVRKRDHRGALEPGQQRFELEFGTILWGQFKPLVRAVMRRNTAAEPRLMIVQQ